MVLRIGTNADPAAVYLGAQAVQRVYLGTTVVWEPPSGGDITAPVISNVVWTQGTATGTADTTEGGTLYVATHTAANTAAADPSGGWTSATLETFTDTVATSGTTPVTGSPTAASSTADRLSFYIRDAAGNNSNIETVNYTYSGGGGGGGSSLFTEDFASYSNDDLLSNNADFSSVAGNGTGFEVQSGVAQLASGSFDVTQIDAVAAVADVRIEVDITNIGDPSGTVNKLALYVRGTANTDRYFVEFFGDGMVLTKRVGSTNSELLNVGSTGLTNGDTVALEVSGTTLRVFRNGAQLGTDVTDSDLTTGRVGLVPTVNGAVTTKLQIDNISVETA